MIKITRTRIALAVVLALAGYMSSVAIRSYAQCDNPCRNQTPPKSQPPCPDSPC